MATDSMTAYSAYGIKDALKNSPWNPSMESYEARSRNAISTPLHFFKSRSESLIFSLLSFFKHLCA